MKEAYYFSHDSNASQDEKILNLRADHGWEGYGIYWAIIERLRDTEGHRYAITSIKGLAASLGIKAMVLTQIINEYGLFENDGDYFWSNSLINRMKIVEAKREDSRKKGIRSGEVRSQKTNQDLTTVEPEMNHGSTAVQFGLNQTRTEVEQGKEKKGNESKGKEIILSTTTTTTRVCDEIFDFFKKKAPPGCDPHLEAEKFIRLNDLKNWSAAGGVENWQEVAELFILRISEHQKHKPNGRPGKVPNPGYNESIANADRIIEQFARGK